MSKISLMFTIKAVEHFFKHWYYSGSVLWSRRKCDSWQEVMRVRDSRWENILGEDWELESPCLGNFLEELGVGAEDMESVTHAGPRPLESITFRWPFAHWWRDTLTACAHRLGLIHRAGGTNMLPTGRSFFGFSL